MIFEGGQFTKDLSKRALNWTDLVGGMVEFWM